MKVIALRTSHAATGPLSSAGRLTLNLKLNLNMNLTLNSLCSYQPFEKRGAHPNTPGNALAAVRVLPTEFTEEAFAMLPAAWRTQIRTLLMLWRRPIGGDDETPFSKLEKGVLYTIFDKLMDQPVHAGVAPA